MTRGLGIGFIAFVAFVILACAADRVAFDAKAWRNGDLRVRGQMARDLAHGNVLSGKTKKEVITMLGPPNKQDSKFVSYQIDLGGYLEKILPSHYYVYVEFASDSDVVTKVSVVDA
jgi:hypothetical protein